MEYIDDAMRVSKGVSINCNFQVTRNDVRKNVLTHPYKHQACFAFRKILSRGISAMYSLKLTEISPPMKSQRSSLCSITHPSVEENAILKTTFTLFRKT